MKKAVLFLTSNDIDLQSLNSSPRLTSYQFYSIAAIPILENQLSNAPKTRLQDLLAEKIRETNPLYLIVHLGLAFERYPVEFLNAVLDIKTLYPAIKIGIDRRIEYIHQQLLAPEMSSEINNLLDRLSMNCSIFDTDKETAYLIGCLH